MKNKPTYEVIVGNIGTVYSGNGRDARRVFAEYKDQSIKNYGRAAGESVTIMKDSELYKEYIGPVETAYVKEFDENEKE